MKDEKILIPDELITALKEHRVIPFIGAGVSRAVEKKVKDNKKSFDPLFPGWKEFLEYSVEKLSSRKEHDEAEDIKQLLALKKPMYLEAAKRASTTLGETFWQQMLKEKLDMKISDADEESLKLSRLVWKLGSKLLITTNVDRVLQWTCPNTQEIRLLDMEKVEIGELLKEKEVKYPTVLYLHGRIHNKRNVVFTPEQYKSFYEEQNNKAKLQGLIHLLTNHTTLFIGFSMDDEYFLKQLNQIDETYESGANAFYILLPEDEKDNPNIPKYVEKIIYPHHGKPLLDLLERMKNIADGDDDSDKSNLPQTPDTPTNNDISFDPATDKFSGTVSTTRKQFNSTIGDKFFNVPFASKGQEFVGRKGKVDEIWELLNKEGCASIGQAVGIKGFGGLGKTQLAVEYAHAYKDKYKNGVFWVVADESIDNQLLQIAEKQGWINPHDKNVNQIDVAKAKFLTLSECLLLFDNVEAYADIKEYLPKLNSQTHALITSREKISEFRSINLELLDRDESRELLLKVSERQPENETESEHLKQILEILGDIPLAIELVGGYLAEHETVSFEKYHQYLNEVPLDELEKEFPEGSFTDHDRSIIQTLRISEKTINEKPLMVEILKALAWSGSSPMGISLLKALIDSESEFAFDNALADAHKLRLLKKDEKEERYAIHRLLAKVIRHENPLEQQSEWHQKIARNLEKWFEPKIGQYVNLLEFEAELEHLREWQEQTVKFLPTEAIMLTAFRGNHYHERGNYKKVNQWIEQALNLYQTNSLDEPQVLGNLFNYLGVNYSELGNSQKAKEFHEEALKIRQELLGDKHSDTAASYCNIGSVYGELGDHQKALEYEEKALELQKELFGESHPDIARSYNNIGGTYGSLGNHQKALEYKKKAFELQKKLLGEKHPNTARSYNNIGSTYGNLGDYHKALQHQEKALELQKELFGENHPDTANSYSTVGRIYGNLGNYQKDLEYQQKALELLKELFGENHPDTARSYNNIGLTYRGLGDHHKALEYQEKALELHKNLFGENHPNTAISYSNVGSTYGNLGDHQEALEYDEKALKIHQELLSKRHPNSITFAKNLIITYQKLGYKEKAGRKAAEYFGYVPQHHRDWKWFEDVSRPYRSKKSRNKKRKGK